jgi:predicted membrane-bound mannosyltransferase
MSREQWPLSWYLRDDPNVAYEVKVVDTAQPVIIALDSQVGELEKTLGSTYRRTSSHELRSGVTLVLYLRRDLVP